VNGPVNAAARVRKGLLNRLVRGIVHEIIHLLSIEKWIVSINFAGNHLPFRGDDLFGLKVGISFWTVETPNQIWILLEARS